MSQAAFLTLNSFIETSNVSIRDDSSINIATPEETDKSFNTSQSLNSSSNDSIVKPKLYFKKSIDEVTEKLKVLQTRLDFKLIIANISKNIEKSKIESPNEKNSEISLSTIQKNDFEKYQMVKPVTTKTHTKIDCHCCIIEKQTRLSNCSTSCEISLNSPDRNLLKTSESYVWTGQLPVKEYKNPKYSNKVFLGGIPWDMTEQGLASCFKKFGSCVFEWPGKDIESGRHPPKGYVYVLFENERSVKNLLFNCITDFPDSPGEYFFRIETSKSQTKNVQVIPWVFSDSSHLTTSAERLDTSKTIFVGGLHGMMTAESIANIFNQLFGDVVYVGIDTDKYKYPIGSGRITFSSYESYAKAIRAKFIEIKSSKFTKKIQIDPYLEDSICSHCNSKQGPFFCREFVCYRYFCSDCWHWIHNTGEMKFHRPVTRQTRPNFAEINSNFKLFQSQ